MNKKKTLAVAGVLGLGAIALTLGTTSYFNDSKKVTNVFTVGNVKVELHEKQRAVDPQTGEKTTELEDFVQEKVLLPFIGNENSGPVDSLGMTTGKNYGDKMVTVENTGNTDAYVRAYIAIPDSVDSANPTDNFLHFNFGRNANGVKTNDSGTGEWLWKSGESWKISTQNIALTAIDGTNDTTTTSFTIYQADYATTLAGGEETARLINGFYLDGLVDDIQVNAAGTQTTICKDANTCTTLDYDIYKYGFQIPVYTVVVQADGFATADDAFNAVLPANFAPFAD